MPVRSLSIIQIVVSQRSRFHPDFHNHNSTVQRQMLQAMHDWVKGLGGKQHETLRRLVKNAVRNHENIRLAGDGSSFFDKWL